MRSSGELRLFSAFLVSPPEPCKALDGMYTTASPEMQAIHRHVHANHPTHQVVRTNTLTNAKRTERPRTHAGQFALFASIP